MADTAAREAELLAKVPTGLLINGEWRDASDGGTFDVIDPATGDVLATLASATSEDALAALDAADKVQASWARTAPRERAEILRRAFELVTERAEDFALLMTLEMGKPLAEARGEVTYGAEFLRWFSEETVRDYGRYVTTPEGKNKILLNLGSVGHIDSSGIGELVSSFTAVNKEGGSLKLLNLTQKIQDLLAITKLLTVFDTYDDEASALASFN